MLQLTIWSDTLVCDQFPLKIGAALHAAGNAKPIKPQSIPEINQITVLNVFLFQQMQMFKLNSKFVVFFSSSCLRRVTNNQKMFWILNIAEMLMYYMFMFINNAQFERNAFLWSDGKWAFIKGAYTYYMQERVVLDDLQENKIRNSITCARRHCLFFISL